MPQITKMSALHLQRPVHYSRYQVITCAFDLDLPTDKCSVVFYVSLPVIYVFYLKECSSKSIVYFKLGL